MIQIQTSGHLLLVLVAITASTASHHQPLKQLKQSNSPPSSHSTTISAQHHQHTQAIKKNTFSSFFVQSPALSHQQCILPAPAPSTTQMITMQSNSHHSHHTGPSVNDDYSCTNMIQTSGHFYFYCNHSTASHHLPLKQLQQRSNSSRSHTTICQWLLHHQHQQPHSNTTISKLLQQTTALPSTPHFKLFPAPTTTQTPKNFSTAPPTTPTKSLP